MLLLLIVGGIGEVMARLRAPGVALEQLAPATRGITLEGAPFDLASYKGRPVFVSLWATWCGPCRTELPDLADSARRHPEVQFVGLTMSSSDAALARQLVAEARVDYPVVMVTAAVDAAWQVSSFPSSVLLDADGHVVWRRAGMVDEGDIAGAFRSLSQQ